MTSEGGSTALAKDGLPFESRIPNEETLAAVRQGRSGKRVGTYSSVEEMRSDLLKDA